MGMESPVSLRLAAYACATFVATAMSVRADVTVDAPSTVTNGGGVLASGDIITVTPTGSITTTGADAISAWSGGSPVSMLTVINQGAVDAIAGGTGIELVGDDAVITNSGRVTSTDEDAIDVTGNRLRFSNFGTVTGGFGGVVMDGDDAVITNSGAINSDVFGVLLSGDNVTYTQSGTGSVALTGPIVAIGVGVAGDGGMVDIAGTVDASANGGLGVLVQGDDTTVDISGTVLGDLVGVAGIGDRTHVTVTGQVTALTEDGIALDGDDGQISNSGTVTANEIGLFIVGDNGAITNSGTLNSVSVGIAVAGGTGATLTNAGTVTSTMDDGIGSFNDNTTVLNSGTVTAGLDGIFLDGQDNRVTNSGVINAQDDGIDSEGRGGDLIVNSGTIIAVRDGIETDGDGVVVTNSGIVMSGDDAFDLNGANSTLNLQRGTLLRGLLSFDGANGTLNFGPGINAALIHDGGAPENISKNGFLAGTVVFNVNPDQFQVSTDHAHDLTQRMHGYMAVPPEPILKVAQGAISSGARVWTTFDASVSDRGANSRSAGYSTRSATWAGGVMLPSGIGFSLGLDQSISDLSGSFKTTSDSIVAGVHGLHEIGAAQLGWAFLAGLSETTNRRTILVNVGPTFTETGVGKTDAVFFSPAISYAHGVSNGALARVALRYLNVGADGYAETGATNNLTFGKQQNHVWSLSPSIEFPTRDFENGARFDMTAGLDLNHFSGDPVTARFGAAGVSLDPNTDDFEARGFLTARYSSDFRSGWSFASHGEFGLSTLNRADFSVGLGLRRRF
ncbi:MAG: hypothetical protein AAGL23_07730 [Pseudomonadota bacterium]